MVKAQPSGTQYLALRPLLSDFVLSMPRGAAVVYPKDAAQIVAMGDVFPGARVVEAGAGSGALTCSLLRAVGDGGRVVSYERRPEFAAVARRNVERFFAGPHPAWELRDGDVGRPPGGRAGRPGRARHARALGGARTRSPRRWCPAACWSRTWRRRRSCPGSSRRCGSTAGSPSRRPGRRLVRPWHVVGLAVRPEHRMVGHTAFLVSARRLAPGVTAPARQRRPAKAAADEAGRSPGDNFHGRHAAAPGSPRRHPGSRRDDRAGPRPAAVRPGARRYPL